MTNNPYTLNQATHGSMEVALPCGTTLTLHRLRNAQRDTVIAQYAHFLASLSVVIDHEPTMDEVYSMLPQVLQDIYWTPSFLPSLDNTLITVNYGRDSVLAFFNAFSAVELTQEIVEQFDIEDYGAIWEALWALARVPFGAGLITARQNGMFLQYKLAWLAATNPAISTPSDAPDSTPAMEA